MLIAATSSQLVDKLEKTRIIRFVKSLEIAIMALTALGFMGYNAAPLLVCVALMALMGLMGLMGLHSTLFGPVRFAYLPQHLGWRELTGGNGRVVMGTIAAILPGRWVAQRVPQRVPHSPATGHRPHAAHPLEPVHRDLAQPAVGARKHRGVQPHQLGGRAAADGRQPAADALFDGLPHLCGASAAPAPADVKPAALHARVQALLLQPPLD